jgi:hypothetical protein
MHSGFLTELEHLPIFISVGWLPVLDWPGFSHFKRRHDTKRSSSWRIVPRKKGKKEGRTKANRSAAGLDYQNHL